MKLVEEYLRRAKECDALAEKAESQSHKAQITLIAKIWRTLAQQREQFLKNRPQKP